jgi:hypothetical protein
VVPAKLESSQRASQQVVESVFVLKILVDLGGGRLEKKFRIFLFHNNVKDVGEKSRNFETDDWNFWEFQVRLVDRSLRSV